MLRLLGDELMGNDRLAIFELVKNAYDANANQVIVRLNLNTDQDPMITVSDDGEGMNLNVLKSVWLVPGNEHRQKQKHGKKRIPTHNRLPLRQ